MDTNTIKAFRSSKGIVQKELADHRSPHLLLRKRSLSRTAKTKNLKTSVGRSLKLNDLHYMFRKDNVAIATLPEQKRIIHEIIDSDEMKLDSQYYVINSVWYQKWKSLVGYDEAEEETEHGDNNQIQGDHVDTTKKIKFQPIDNQRLLESNQLRANLTQDDYVIIPKKAWKKLLAWYGGGPAICRPTVIVGNNLKVELSPIQLRVMKVVTEEVRNFSFSGSCPIKDVRRRIASALAVPLVKCRLFVHQDEITTEENLSKTLDELKIKNNQVIIMRNQDDKVVLSGRMMGINNIKPEQTLVEKILGKPIEQVSYPVKMEEAGLIIPKPIAGQTSADRLVLEITLPKKELKGMDELQQIAQEFVEAESARVAASES